MRRLLRLPTFVLVANLLAGCGGHVDAASQPSETEAAASPPTRRVTGILTLTTGDYFAATAPDRAKTRPLPATRVFLLPLVRCNQVYGRPIAESEADGFKPVASAYSTEDGAFELLAAPGSYSFFADVDGWPFPAHSSGDACNRVDVAADDVMIRDGLTNVDRRRD